MPQDYTGITFGDWIVIGPAPQPVKGHRKAVCRCRCGAQREVLVRSLLNGRSTSCGRCRHSIIGQRFGRLVVIEQLPGGKVRCACDCGQEKMMTRNNVKAGTSASCGCLHREMVGRLRRTHGLSNGRTYRIWCAMKQRATNPNLPCAEYYFGKGVRCCQRWLDSFESFLADMGECPSDLTIDRIDPDGDYEPDNCRWISIEDQQRNRGLRRWAKRPRAES